MSLYYQENGKFEVVKFGKSLTKQSFKDETDINKILAKAQKAGSLDHLTAHEAEYGDFAGYDLMEHFEKIERAQNIFDDLPSEVRNEFKNEPGLFFDFVNDPVNMGKLRELLPAIAAPGQYFPDMSSQTMPGALKEPSNVVEEAVVEEQEVKE